MDPSAPSRTPKAAAKSSPEPQDTPASDVQRIEMGPVGPAQPERAQWWGQYNLPIHRQGRWRLGPTTIWLQHMQHEWRLATHTLPDESYEKSVHAAVPVAIENVPKVAAVQRYCFVHMCDQVRLVPALPDRAVVSRPDTPLSVFPGEQVTIYLSFPLWLRIEVGEPARLLQEVPVYRLSDTWFGANTRQGELCYASRTVGTVHLQSLIKRPYRAQSAVVVRNQGQTPLLLERISVNMPALSLWVDGDNVLWTNALIVERVEGSGMATFHVEPRPPSVAKDVKFISGPRVVEHKSAFARAFGSMLS